MVNVFIGSHGVSFSVNFVRNALSDICIARPLAVLKPIIEVGGAGGVVTVEVGGSSTSHKVSRS